MNMLVNKLSNVAYTENGALTNKSTENDFLDLFYNISNPLKDVASFITILDKCLSVNVDLTYRILMYGRDILRGGGRRDRFVTAVNYLTNTGYDTVRLLSYSVNTGISYYKDWINVYNSTSSENFKYETVQEFASIIRNLDSSPTIYDANLLKWLPRKGELFNEIRKVLKVSPKELRKILVTYGKSVEQLICGKDWEHIKFETLPGKSIALHRKMFSNRDETKNRFSEFLVNVAAGKTTMNVGTTVNAHDAFFQPADFAQAAYVTMLDKLTKVNAKVLVVSDTSDSMTWYNDGAAMKVSLSMAALFGSAITGDFHNSAITFSAEPRFITWDDSDDITTILDKITTRIAQNTNIQAVFDLILGVAVAKGVPQSDMPEFIMLISDMQFDKTVDGSNRCVDNIVRIKQKYAESGYDMPQMIYWNVNDAGYDNSPITANERGIMVSGFSQNVWNSMFDIEFLENKTPLNFMLEAVNIDRYSLPTENS